MYCTRSWGCTIASSEIFAKLRIYLFLLRMAAFLISKFSWRLNTLPFKINSFLCHPDSTKWENIASLRLRGSSSYFVERKYTAARLHITYYTYYILIWHTIYKRRHDIDSSDYGNINWPLHTGYENCAYNSQQNSRPLSTGLSTLIVPIDGLLLLCNLVS